MVKQMLFFAVASGVLALLLTVGTGQANPVPAKILGKYVLSYKPPGPQLNLNPHGHPDEDELDDLSNGIESEERDGDDPDSHGYANHYRYRPQYQESVRQEQQHQHQQQHPQYDEQDQEQEQDADVDDYVEDSVPASANHQHQYMTTYKTATRHVTGGSRPHSSYSSAGSGEEEEEGASASEESHAYDAFRAYKGTSKKHQNLHSPGGGLTSLADHQDHLYHHHQQQQQQQQQQHQLQQKYQHHNRQQTHQQLYQSGHSSYHPQLIHAYKILHGTPNRLPTSHEYHDDDSASVEEEDEDYRIGGAAIGGSLGASGYGDYGPQVIHTKGRAVPISQHVEIETPVPVPYVKKIHVPIPQEVRVKIPHPVLVPVPRPYPVHIPVSQPIAIPDIKEITVPIEKVVPYPVEKKIPVPIEKPVPYPIEKHVPVYLPQPIPVKVPIVKTIIHKVKQQTASGPPLPPGSGSFW